MNEDGCPCEGTCCERPRTQRQEHDCGDPECSCDERWVAVCLTCGASCCCEV